MAVSPLPYDDRDYGLAALQDQWAWLLAIGVAFLLLGTIGILSAVLFTIASVVLFGALLLAGAALQFVETYRAGRWRGRWPHLLVALVYGVAGAIMLLDPVDASVGLTLVLAILLLVVGVMRIVLSLQIRPTYGWGWMLAAGIVMALLGTLVLAAWPEAALWVIGLFVAIELVVNGWLLVLLGLAARRATLTGAQAGGRSAQG
ncbi:MAG TPA: DUF308 domain-containing protein [Burkholderiales bacterium]|nr:DUF308 domain-containing protein [Burkholderiales bacterium]